MLTRLYLENLRCIARADLTLKPGLNLIVGGNGSGKTSLLEGIHLLAVGRSFRHRETAPLLREGADTVRLFCSLVGAGGAEHRLGMQQQDAGWLIRLDGGNVRRRSDVVSLLPCHWIGPDPQALVTGPPHLRRSFLDSGMFHVEHDYLAHLNTYQRALEQRNAALRTRSPEFYLWDSTLDKESAWLDTARARYMQTFVPRVTQRLVEWGAPFDIGISYHRGWDAEMPMAEALCAAHDTDRKRGFTGLGSHRADLIIKSGLRRSGKRLSRGQLKMLVSALYIAQAEVLHDAGAAHYLLLYDDLASELDEGNRERLLETLSRTYPQTIITGLSRSDIPPGIPIETVFHVEHGALSVVP